ncbi:MAG: AraC family transcriptional regulator [Myxococcota bacterium]|nr:AraC family transcriptional regulator [Myxococcota bacterium]
MVLLRGLVHAASACGVDRAQLLAKVGVSEHALEHDLSVPTVVIAQAWQVAPQLSGDPLFGLHAGDKAEIGSYDILDYLFLTSATLGDACHALARYHRIVSEIWRLSLRVDGPTARFQQWVPPPFVETLRHAWDYFFAGALKRIRSALPAKLVPREVHLMHSAVGDLHEYERVLGCRVAFDHPIGEFVFDASYLEQRLLSSNPTLHRLVRRHADELLARVPSDQDLLVRAQTLLPVLLKDPQLSLAGLAEQLGVGERTLQRKLADHKLTYKQLVQRAREEVAIRGLESGALSVQELAYELGFNSTASFSRAFRQWRGMAPSEWQTQARRVRSTD